MSGFPFTTNLGQNLNFLPPYYTLDANGQPVVQPNAYQLQTTNLANYPQPGDGLTSPFIDYEDQTRTMATSAGASRARRRTGAAGEHVKFRRTRSGCYTCRNRRVKCDEGRPICERCRKGNRECVYPEPSAITKTRRSSSKGKANHDDSSSPDSSHADIEDEDPNSAVSGPPESPLLERSPTIQRSNTGEISNSSTPTEGEADLLTRRPDISSNRTRSSSLKFADSIPADIRSHLQYAKENFSAMYYNLQVDGSDFVQTLVIENALKYEPLLYAVACFAAYHQTLRRPDGAIKHFLGYHTKSIKLLHDSLKKSRKHTHFTLLTILQLATIEESLGDWVNLMGHQKAAHQILVELYTPENFTSDMLSINIVKWYMHFDVYVGMLSGTPSMLTRDWLESLHEHFSGLYRRNPEDIILLYEESMGSTRLLGHDLFVFFNKMSSGMLSDMDLETESQILINRLDNWERNFPIRLMDPNNIVKEFPTSPYNPNDPTDPYKPGFIFGGINFPTNQFRLGILGLRNMFETKIAAWKGLPKPEKSSKNLATVIFEIVNAVRFMPDPPPGALLNMRAVFSLAIFLNTPTRAREIQWARETFAAIESEGYIFPASMRAKLEALWMVDLSSWWLPGNEGAPNVILSIRDFTAERMNILKDDKSENLREMRGIFNTLSLSDASSPESMQSPSSSSNARGTSDKRSPDDTSLHVQESPDFSWSTYETNQPQQGNNNPM